MLQLQVQMLFLYYNKETKDRKRDIKILRQKKMIFKQRHDG